MSDKKINKTGDMLFQSQITSNDKLMGEDTGSQELANQPPPSTMTPMSPMVASATVINLILATGPFRYEQNFLINLL